MNVIFLMFIRLKINILLKVFYQKYFSKVCNKYPYIGTKVHEVGKHKLEINIKWKWKLLSFSWLLATPWTAAHQASLSIIIFWSLPKLMSIESVMPSNRFILCYPLLLPSLFPSVRVFSNKSALCIWWPKYWSFSFSHCPFNEYSEEIFTEELNPWRRNTNSTELYRAPAEIKIKILYFFPFFQLGWAKVSTIQKSWKNGNPYTFHPDETTANILSYSYNLSFSLNLSVSLGR